jgi:hypothetical protein
MGVKDISARAYGQKVAEMARKDSSEAFYALRRLHGGGGVLIVGGYD